MIAKELAADWLAQIREDAAHVVTQALPEPRWRIKSEFKIQIAQETYQIFNSKLNFAERSRSSAGACLA